MNITQISKLFENLDKFQVSSIDYESSVENPRWDPKSEYIIKMYLESLGLKVVKKDFMIYNYDYDVFFGDTLIARLEIKETHKPVSTKYDIKIFEENYQGNRKDFQGRCWDLSRQLFNSGIDYHTVFVKVNQPDSNISLTLLSVMDNDTILNSVDFDLSLSMTGTIPLGSISF